MLMKVGFIALYIFLLLDSKMIIELNDKVSNFGYDFTMGRLGCSCLPSLLLKERASSSSTNIDEAVGLLCSATSGISNLASEGTISLQWCCQAIGFLQIMHSHFQLLIEKHETANKAKKDVNYLDLYMEDTLKLLDLCNWLKSTIFGMNKYWFNVELAVKNFYDDELQDEKVKFEIERLERESWELYGFQIWKDIKFSRTSVLKVKTKDGILHVINVLESLIDATSMLIFGMVIYPVSVNVDEEVFEQFPQMRAIAIALQKLVSALSKKLHGVEDKTKPVFSEYKMVESAVSDIKAEILKGNAMDKGKLQKRIDLLQSSSIELKNGLQLFENLVNELFDEVIKGRNRFLAMLEQN